MKLYQVAEAIIPIANDIYDKSSLDLVEVDNPSNRVICAPGEFEFGEVLTSEEFKYDNRSYENEDGSSSVSGVFAVRVNKKLKTFKIPVTWESWGIVYTEAETLDQALDIFDKTCDEIPLPEAEYVDGSFYREDEESCSFNNQF